MATEGIIGLYVETRDFAASAAFWRALGYDCLFETDHGSGQFVHPAGGPYVFVAEHHDGPLTTHPILAVADADAFVPAPSLTVARPFEPQHWGVTEAMLHDPDGRDVSLQAPLPDDGGGD